MLKKHSDKKLIEGIRRGNDVSVNYLYDSFFDIIKSYVLKNSGTVDDAYDIFQDALMILFKKIQSDSLEPGTNIKRYITGVSKNLWHEQLRRKKKDANIEPEPEEEFDPFTLLDTPLEQIVQRSFLKLKAECRRVIEMSIKNKAYSDIAKEMDYKSEEYARRKKYLCKEALLNIIKSDPEY